MTPDLVIFDCDGVLVDSEIISNTVLSEVLTSIGLCITPNDCMDLFLGKSWEFWDRSRVCWELKTLGPYMPPPTKYDLTPGGALSEISEMT